MFLTNVNSSFSVVAKNIATSAVLLSGLLVATNASAQYTEVTRLGTSTSICKGGISTAAELQEFFANSPDKVNSILQHAGWAGDSQALFTAVANGNFVSKKYEIGSTFDWMSAMREGQAVSLPSRIWAGKEAFDGFEVNVVSECVNYQMVVPYACCNLSMATSSVIKKDVALTTELIGDSLKVCTDSSAKLSMTDASGESKDLPLDENGCWTGSQLAAGSYSFQAIDECGVATATAAITAPVVEETKIVPFITPFIGSESLMRYETRWEMDMDDSSGLVGVRGGMKFGLGKGFYLVPALSIFTRTSVNEGITYPEEGASLDLGLEKYVSENIFVGAGIGAWNIDDSDYRQSSVFLTAGGNISKSSEWFAEVRGIGSDNVDGKDGYSDNHAYNVGVRFKF